MSSTAHTADPGKASASVSPRGSSPPFDLADGLAGNTRQGAHPCWLTPQPGPVLLQPAVQRHPLIPFPDNDKSKMTIILSNIA